MSHEEKPPLSDVVPLLVAALICDVAVADPATGKKNLIGIFDRLTVGTFPAQRPLCVYIKLTDAEGFYEVELRFVERESNGSLAIVKGEVQVKDRLKSVDLYIPFLPLPFPRAGRYEFQIWTNGAFLGSTFMDAVLRQQETPREDEQ